jgi:hypothetical protein
MSGSSVAPHGAPAQCGTAVPDFAPLYPGYVLITDY